METADAALERVRRERQLDLINSAVIGTAVAVGWAYVLLEQADPEGRCPKRSTRCWVLVGLLAMSVVAFPLLLPLLTLPLVRRLEKSKAEQAPSSDEACRALVQLRSLPQAVKPPTFLVDNQARRLRIEFFTRLQTLLTSAATSCWVVTNVSFVYYMLQQLYVEVSATVSSDDESDDDDDERRRDQYFVSTGARAKEGDDFVYFVVVCAGFCSVAVACYFAVIIAASRRLSTETRPYWADLCLLLQTGSCYPLAYSVVQFLSVLFFAPVEFGIGNGVGVFRLALVEAVIVFFAARQTARVLFARLDLEANLPRTLARHLDDPSTWVLPAIVLYFSCPVFAVVAVMQCLSTLLSDVFDLGSWDLICFYLVLAPLLLVVAVRRSRATVARATVSDDDDDKLDRHPEETPMLDRDEPPKEPHCAATVWDCFFTRKPEDTVFEDTFERWLVVLCFWQIYKLLLIEAWDHVGIDVSYSAKNTAAHVLTIIGRLLWQLTVAVLLTLVFATVPAILMVASRP